MSKRVLLGAICLVVAATVAACAPKPSGPQGAQDSPDASDESGIAWSADMSCEACHAGYADGAGSPNEAHELLDVECVTCHTADEITSVHEDRGDSGRVPEKLRYSDVPEGSCLGSGCHDDEAALVEKTADALLTDEHGTAKNPHEVLGQTGHEGIECMDCHTMHDQADVLEAAESTCFSCHHDMVFECGTCH